MLVADDNKEVAGMFTDHPDILDFQRHQYPGAYTSTVTSFASSGPVLINVCVQEMSTPI
jgi:hypothetical protein